MSITGSATAALPQGQTNARGTTVQPSRIVCSARKSSGGKTPCLVARRSQQPRSLCLVSFSRLSNVAHALSWRRNIVCRSSFVKGCIKQSRTSPGTKYKPNYQQHKQGCCHVDCRHNEHKVKLVRSHRGRIRSRNLLITAFSMSVFQLASSAYLFMFDNFS